MAGRHSKRRGPHRVPEQRGPRRLGITDAHTHVEHLVTDESAMEHRHSGRYLAMCGAQVLAASLAAPGRGHCATCLEVNPMTWYVRSSEQHDTHRGTVSRGAVDAVCGIRFEAVARCARPSDPDRICPRCHQASER